MTNMKKTTTGFTLIELMIVVAIIGILSSYAIPAYNNYIKKSEIASAQATLRALIPPAEMWYLENGNFSSSNILQQLGSAPNVNPLGTIALNNKGVLSFTFSEHSHFSSQSTLNYRRTSNGWQCYVNSKELETKNCAYGSEKETD
ncbi:prepilin-type N-terminal cleavage/methylation domain-containing protein [Vibrio sp. MACH09]|nr:prepilin-type N-terminal cleavage/methylation domain-containing protein [Vibrio sp. MACH09]NOI66172.1 prepilin-type N-terminal cleavage/methylation domain-containing protein [Vibrio sp. 99-8-1]